MLDFFSVCDQEEVDLVLVLDSSGSVGPKNFGKVKNFIKKFLKAADIDGGKVRVGIDVYSTFDEVAFNLNTFNSKADIFSAIDALPYKGQGTKTGRALETMRTEMFTVANGDRPDVDNVVLVITDGESFDTPIPVADAARADGIHIYAIGVGLTETEELRGIANKPSVQNVFIIDDFSGLDDLDKQVFASVCGGSSTHFSIIFQL